MNKIESIIIKENNAFNMEKYDCVATFILNGKKTTFTKYGFKIIEDAFDWAVHLFNKKSI